MTPSQFICAALLSLTVCAASPATVRGGWRVTGITVPAAPDYQVPRALYPEGMPGVGSVLRFSGKRMCIISPQEERICHQVSTERSALADTPGGTADARLLKIPGATNFILLILDGRAAFGLVVMPDHRLFADFAVCPQPSNCTAAFEIWSPMDKGSTVVLSK